MAIPRVQKLTAAEHLHAAETYLQRMVLILNPRPGEVEMMVARAQIHSTLALALELNSAVTVPNRPAAFGEVIPATPKELDTIRAARTEIRDLAERFHNLDHVPAFAQCGNVGCALRRERIRALDELLDRLES